MSFFRVKIPAKKFPHFPRPGKAAAAAAAAAAASAAATAAELAAAAAWAKPESLGSRFKIGFFHIGTPIEDPSIPKKAKSWFFSSH